jgi:hypothetical protein
MDVLGGLVVCNSTQVAGQFQIKAGARSSTGTSQYGLVE